MTERKSFYRKLSYGGAIAILLYPLALLSRPATLTDPAGGTLSAMRREHGLSQANLGEIDPASATMKLATLGLRGVAVNILWNKADEYKKKEDWTNFSATLQQLAHLQPHFITFWKFQAWNVAYNVSVQVDDYRDRYYYVRQGIDFLQEGIRKNYENRDIPQLLWDLGWFLHHKIGRSDEREQYRRLFREDDAFHGEEIPRGSDQRDSWLAAKRWFQEAAHAVDHRHKSLGKKSGKIFFSSPAKAQINYAETIGEEGYFDKAKRAWELAETDWREFGDRLLEHSTGIRLQLGHEEELAQAVEQQEAELEQWAPGLREKIRQERHAELSTEEQQALSTPEEERNARTAQLARQGERKLTVSDLDLVNRIATEHPQQRKAAGITLKRLEDLRDKLAYTQRYKQDTNYDYWLLRTEFEQAPEARAAREKMFLAKQAYKERAAVDEAIALYEAGFRSWRQVLDQFPVLLDVEGTTGDDLMVFIEQYRYVLSQRDRSIPDDFPLWEVIENFDVERNFVEELRDRQRRLKEEPRESSPEPAEEASPPDASQEQPSPDQASATAAAETSAAASAEEEEEEEEEEVE